MIVDTLEQALLHRGHDVEVLRLPFHSDVSVMLEQMLALRLLHIEDSGDRLICIRTPSYLLRHPSKVIWFIHHHRQAYDLWGTAYGDIPNTVQGRAYRDMIRKADDRAFSEARAIFTNSAVVSQRLQGFNGISSEVLYPPLAEGTEFRCDEYGDELVYVSRLTGHKRQELAIEAMRHTESAVRLVVAGQADAPAEADRLSALISAWDLEDRVELRARWISEEEKTDLMARALAVVYCPVDEDSYGYPTLEGHMAAKAVVSTTDAGGVVELVVHGLNGFLAEPTPESLARHYDQLFNDRQLARRMGEKGAHRLVELGISWDHVVDRLLA